MARLAFLLPDMRGGGAERVAINLAREFIERGHEVDLVLMRAGGELSGLLPSAVRVFDLGATRIRYALWPLIRYLRNRSPAGMQVRLWPLTIVAILAARLSRVSTRIVVSDHNALTEQYKESAVVMAALKASTRLFYPLAEARVVVSAGAARDLARLSKLARNRFTVIHNPIAYPPRPIATNEVVERLWSGDEPRILAVGSLKKQKNYPLLIRAFATLVQRRPARLMILGEGELREQLEQLVGSLNVSDLVRLPGFAVDPWPYYASANLFVLSSDFEGFGNVIVEAMHAGLPVVSTDCPSGPAEILERGRYGTLVPCGDPDALASAMAAAIDNKVYPDVYKKRAKAFAMESAADRYIELLLGPKKGMRR